MNMSNCVQVRKAPQLNQVIAWLVHMDTHDVQVANNMCVVWLMLQSRKTINIAKRLCGSVDVVSKQSILLYRLCIEAIVY